MATNNNNHVTNFKKQDNISIIIVPFPAQGHLNQLLQLSCLISSHNFPVHYIGFSIHNRQAKVRANGLDPLELSRIHFHDIPPPEFASPLPNPNASMKFPEHLQPSWDATLALRGPVAEILQEIASNSRKIILVHDPLMAYVIQDAQNIPNAETYIFNCIPAFTVSLSRWEEKGKPSMIDDEITKNLPSWEGCLTEEMFKFAIKQVEHCNFQAGEIFNSSRLIDGVYLDLMAREELSGTRKIWAIGPILPVKISNQEPVRKHYCLEWLGKQPENSVIYVAFGTMTSVSEEEVSELAIGLEQSKQRFIWVLRDADKGNIFDKDVRKIELPEGFEERVQDYGIIVRDWAPQLEILAHKSTGGFMSHCGWNSCIESFTMGVPIAAWPMHSDQAMNTVYITQVLKVGLVAREWAQREEPVEAGAIAKNVQRLMESPEGDEIRKKAEELGDALRKSIDEGGVARMESDSFIAHITK
ncbi:glycosyltransferase [Lithospermum erythrorhizon]|uniref:Glycosyltransferase n=1 Tax=Lithospermum erythrorhizon TaxID=34254 RepID=A0AAV3RXS5_LITER